MENLILAVILWVMLWIAEVDEAYHRTVIRKKRKGFSTSNVFLRIGVFMIFFGALIVLILLPSHQRRLIERFTMVVFLGIFTTTAALCLGCRRQKR